jgi:integrase
MSSIRQTPSGNFELKVSNKLLPKEFYSTFSSREVAEAYGNRLEALLKQGIVPAGLLDKKNDPTSWTLSRCIVEYVATGAVKASEVNVLDTIRPQLVHESTSSLNYDWCEAWVNRMKREQNLSPSTIRHRVGALKRCIDHIIRKHPDIIAHNPFKLLKKGFATYTAEDARVLARAGKEVKEDVERDRRLGQTEAGDDEEELVRAALKDRPHEMAFFTLALESAMRMREAYTIDLSQVSIAKKTINLTKTKNGDNRQVPLTTVAADVLRNYLQTFGEEIKARNGIVFPYWNGDSTDEGLRNTTSATSQRFNAIFKEAGLVDFVFHDLRHEATCRLYIRTTLSDILIAKITGHKDLRMLKRYASLRGSDLAEMLW